ncbi:putative nuclease HARBI1 [Odontomachus brunneus]|uniref:putative nuclease HARBI1 n=1 Tax=Odontomachus brunneus TaxID=486640 RepID=UPI0013F1C87D|nr:putative nuclease HARBI1 [Odontomachus brunneus]
MPEYIQWPNHVYKTTCIDVFEERSYGFPGVIGAIDGCHIPCKQPKDNAHDYYNRKGFHSIILQGICDHRRKFIDCFIGLPGRIDTEHLDNDIEFVEGSVESCDAQVLQQ